MPERPTPDARYPGKSRPSRGHPRVAPTARKPAHKSARCGVGDGCPCPPSPHPQQVGSLPRPHAPRTGSQTCASTQFRTPHTKARGAPPGTLAPPQRCAKPASKCARCGDGEGSPSPHPPRPRKPGSGPRLPAQWMGPCVRESTQPRTPHTRARGAPPSAALVPFPCDVGMVRDPTPSLCALEEPRAAGPGRLPQGRTVGGGRVPNPGHPSAPPGNRTGDARAGTDPPSNDRQSKGSDQELRRSTNRLERPYQRPARGPLKGRAQNNNSTGERRPPRVREHTNTQQTRGAHQNGQPDRARGTHRPYGMAYQQTRTRGTRMGQAATGTTRDAGGGTARGGGGQEAAAAPACQLAVSAAHTRGHCTRQGSSGAQRYAPTCRLAASSAAHGGPTGDKPVARARQRRHPG